MQTENNMVTMLVLNNFKFESIGLLDDKNVIIHINAISLLKDDINFAVTYGEKNSKLYNYKLDKFTTLFP